MALGSVLEEIKEAIVPLTLSCVTEQNQTRTQALPGAGALLGCTPREVPVLWAEARNPQTTWKPSPTASTDGETHVSISKVCVLTCQQFRNNINVLEKFLIGLMVRIY